MIGSQSVIRLSTRRLAIQRIAHSAARCTASTVTDVRPTAAPAIATTAETARYAARTVVAVILRRRLSLWSVLVSGRYIRLVPLEIAAVESSRDLRRFVGLPWQIYNPVDHPQWVPPLRIAVRDALDRKNPFYRTADRQLFLAHRGGRLVGRIAAIENRAHNEFHSDRVGF